MQFARDHPEVTIVGVGAGSATNGDSVALADQFVSRYEATLPNMVMLYDVSFRSWRNFGVSQQPWTIVYDQRGELIFSTPGRVDLDSIAVALGL